MVCPSRSINPSKGVLYLGFMDSDVIVCSHTQPAAAVLPRKIMNALPCRATMLPRCQAAKTALHINNEELLTPKMFYCENVDLLVCPSGAFLKVQANSPAIRPESWRSRPGEPSGRLRNLLVRVSGTQPSLVHDSRSHAPAASPMVVGITEHTPTRDCGR